MDCCKVLQQPIIRVYLETGNMTNGEGFSA